jgi:hypothetical protein
LDKKRKTGPASNGANTEANTWGNKHEDSLQQKYKKTMGAQKYRLKGHKHEIFVAEFYLHNPSLYGKVT